MGDSSNSKGRVRAGVTIVELVVVVVLIGILSALAVPRLFTATSLTSLDGDFVRLGQAIELGRKAAMKSGIRHYLSLNTGAGQWALYKEKSGDSTLSTTSDSLVFRDGLSKTIRFGFSFSVTGAISSSKYSAPTTGFTETQASAGSTGVAKGLGSDACIDGGAASGQADWAVVTFCGGPTSRMESGVVYLSSTRFNKRLQAILYNPDIDLHLLRFSWNGSAWRME